MADTKILRHITTTLSRCYSYGRLRQGSILAPDLTSCFLKLCIVSDCPVVVHPYRTCGTVPLYGSGPEDEEKDGQSPV